MIKIHYTEYFVEKVSGILLRNIDEHDKALKNP